MNSRDLFLGFPHELHTSKVLSDRGIIKALQDGRIKCTPEITLEPEPSKQIQPGSLDLNIGDVAIFDSEVRSKAAKANGAITLQDCESGRLDEILDLNAKRFSGEQENYFEIETKARAEIGMLEKLVFNPEEFALSFTLRSSRGRPSLVPANNSLEGTPSNLVCAIDNMNPNTIGLLTRTPFLQVFFHDLKGKGDGYTVFNPIETEYLAKICFESEATTIGPYVILKVGQKALKYNRRRDSIDLRKKYSDEELYEILNCQKGFIVSPGDAHVISLEPRFKLPANVGFRILKRWPNMFHGSKYLYGLDNNNVQGEWVDPGYNGNATAHQVRKATAKQYKTGDDIAVGIFYQYYQDVLRPYGTESLGSHYQGSKGDGSKS